jgi:hypothetical protein
METFITVLSIITLFHVILLIFGYNRLYHYNRDNKYKRKYFQSDIMFVIWFTLIVSPIVFTIKSDIYHNFNVYLAIANVIWLVIQLFKFTRLLDSGNYDYKKIEFKFIDNFLCSNIIEKIYNKIWEYVNNRK